ncbi:MAG: hypothetical protein LJE96_17445 [Deltaproteobacteria bacterium]|nr:hypothetical protein [Deltaproteobacteria bacterium]
MTNPKELPFSGIVTARNCPTCGHHEIGLISDQGVFRPLRPGTRVLVMDGIEPEQTPTPMEKIIPPGKSHEAPLQTPEGRYWVPEPLKGNRRMRLKYGVITQGETESALPTGRTYESAFLQKLNYLLEKEVHVPIAVILDRFFAAPHLASGETKDIAFKMLEELEEVRRPVELVKQWLEKPDEKNLNILVQPGTLENLDNSFLSEAKALEELGAMDLEDFLELL